MRRKTVCRVDGYGRVQLMVYRGLPVTNYEKVARAAVANNGNAARPSSAAVVFRNRNRSLSPATEINKRGNNNIRVRMLFRFAEKSVWNHHRRHHHHRLRTTGFRHRHAVSFSSIPTASMFIMNDTLVIIAPPSNACSRLRLSSARFIKRSEKSLSLVIFSAQFCLCSSWLCLLCECNFALAVYIYY